jgi:hypothetical protein
VCNQGAVLMCDGQYVQAPDIGACVAELEREGVEVSGPTVERTNVSEIAKLTGQGASCSVEEPTRLRFAGVLFSLLSFGLGANLLRRHRRE